LAPSAMAAEGADPEGVLIIGKKSERPRYQQAAVCGQMVLIVRAMTRKCHEEFLMLRVCSS